MTVQQIASICHEANRAYCEAIGDSSQLPWNQAPEWQRLSAVEGVQHALDGESPEQLHESWSKTKTDDGWVFGEVKDAEAKTHPCLVSYAQLPAAQQLKDALFLGVVNALKGV